MEAAPPKLGPLVRRSVHHGAALWFLGVFQFLLVMAVVEYAWTYPYSLTKNYISDLGNTACGPWPDASSAVVCSPWHTAFNISLVVFGIFLLLGAFLLKSAFPARKSSTAGLGLVVVAGIGTILVGLFPENVNSILHTVGSVLAILVGGVALVVLSLARFRDTRWDGYRAYSLLSGLLAVVAFGVFAAGYYFALGPGGMERLAVAPEFLWLLLGPIHLLYIPAYAPKSIPGS